MAHYVAQKKKQNSTSCQNVKVAVRVRPFNEKELCGLNRSVLTCISSREMQLKDKRYTYDRVFQPESSQLDVYNYVVAPMITDVIAGYNCTVFAYGQTGTGKTHTMMGGDPSTMMLTLDWKKDEMAGCIPRAAANIFAEITSMNVTEYNVRVSFLELYNEEVRDLLNTSDQQPPLSIYDNKGAVVIQNLTEKTVFNSKDIYALLAQGNQKRQTASTLMNNHSSRSHTVFTIIVHIRESNERDEEVMKTGKINLVDLAGSENILKSGAKDKRAQELANINRSLLTLGRVIQTLTDKNNKHVPYRDSKLTRILQDSLGGHTKTCIIATVSPAYTSFEETQSTLEYAMRARDIKNTPTVNEKVAKAQMIKEMTAVIEKLKRDLDTARSGGDGFYIPHEHWEEINVQMQTNSQSLTLKNEMIEKMKQELTELETIQEIKAKQYDDIMNECRSKDKIINKCTTRLKKQNAVIKQENYVSTYYLNAATEYNNKAKELQDTTRTLSENQNKLKQKLDNQYFINDSNKKLVNEKCQVLGNITNQIKMQLDNLILSKNDVALEKSLANSNEDLCHQFMEQIIVWKSQLDVLLQDVGALSTFSESNFNSAISHVGQTMEEAGNMLEMVDTDCNKFEKHGSKVICGIEAIISNYRNNLVRSRQTKRKQLETIQNEIMDIDRELEELDKGSKKFITEYHKEQNNIKERYTTLSSALHDNKNNLNEFQEVYKLNHAKTVKNLQQIKQHINEFQKEKTATEESFVNQNLTQIATIKNINDDLDKKIDHLINNENSVLQTLEEVDKDLKQKTIPAEPEGDTPKQSSLRFSERLQGTLSRSVLIKKFKEQYDEDANESLILNASLDSTVAEPLDSTVAESPDSIVAEPLINTVTEPLGKTGE